jgi:hypothetical protein
MWRQRPYKLGRSPSFSQQKKRVVPHAHNIRCLLQLRITLVSRTRRAYLEDAGILQICEHGLTCTRACTIVCFRNFPNKLRYYKIYPSYKQNFPKLYPQHERNTEREVFVFRFGPCLSPSVFGFVNKVGRKSILLEREREWEKERWLV